AVRRSNGKIDASIVSDRLSPTRGKLRVRLTDFYGKTALDKTLAMSVPALSSDVYLSLDEQNLLVNTDPHRVFLVLDFEGEDGARSRNTLFFDATKTLDLPPSPAIQLSWSGTSVTLSSASLARDVYLSFGDLDVQPSDNYFDLLPGEPVTLHLKTSASAQQLKDALTITQLTDAFSSSTTEAQ
ncbi:MAG: hypothetical protein JOZ43_03160, partial [Acidobacteriales bacterium]|nr:hypothetical protein [Terriglobales bacterium]